MRRDFEIIEIPITEEVSGKIITRSFKIYENVLKIYNEFCNENPRFRNRI